MAETGLLIEWKAELDPKDSATKLSRTIGRVDEAVFKDTTFMHSVWNTVFFQISKFVRKRFDSEGPGWKSLVPKYREWKSKNQGKFIDVGPTFGKRKIKFTEIGRLTGTLKTSATKKNKDANIFKVENVPNFRGGAFKYAIDLRKLPYAGHFDNVREFFFLTAKEQDQVMKTVWQQKVWPKIKKTYEKK